MFPPNGSSPIASERSRLAFRQTAVFHLARDRIARCQCCLQRVEAPADLGSALKAPPRRVRTVAPGLVAGIGASSEAKNCRPISVICQPLSSRSTNALVKISSFGARAANRRIRLVQSDPLDTRTLT